MKFEVLNLSQNCQEGSYMRFCRILMALGLRELIILEFMNWNRYRENLLQNIFLYVLLNIFIQINYKRRNN